MIPKSGHRFSDKIMREQMSALSPIASNGFSMSSALFSPIKLAGLALANRLIVSPMCQYSGDDGCANDWHLMHLGMLAHSGASLVVVEATHVERAGRITHGCLGTTCSIPSAR